ncbi:helix-turn-helix domain-containing protein [Streptosporangium saharense]|uniref:DNA-binding transcriptional ArsR family regulator n=1 Tax=Streptosporangium saharense TaxID=1706840 RepID=A0A7W7VQ81_9ACTN|nr:helix-turn-helix domain-containing protein [Streptosporangium saharense]MBB4918269.1 DNA-binding transcriptional ArsR family regulator [Streptosporangium saharense]
MQGFSELQLGDLDEVKVSVVLHPGATLLSLTAGTLGGRPHGVPRHWQRAVMSAAPRNAAEVLRPLFAPSFSVIPDCVSPTVSMSEADADSHLERLADLSPETLLAELEAEFPPAVPAQWRPVVERPGAWIQAYSHLMRVLWKEFRPVWRRADSLLKRERERIGAAAVTDRLELVMGNLSPRFHFSGTTLGLPDQQAKRFDLGGRRLSLVPIVSGNGASIFAFDDPRMVWIGYPLPALGVLWDDGGPDEVSPDSLALTLGQARAAILRAAAASLTMSEVATLLRSTPAAATYHCAQLEAAGLLDRERHGRNVRIRATAKGEALVALLT